jgi:predicted GNAT family acetyltransferase
MRPRATGHNGFAYPEQSSGFVVVCGDESGFAAVIMSDSIDVVHNAGAHRYEATVDGHISICEYTLQGDQLVVTHTAVPSELRGRGIAERLVRAALADARKRGLLVVPACSYVATFIARHKEFQDLLAR